MPKVFKSTSSVLSHTTNEDRCYDSLANTKDGVSHKENRSAMFFEENHDLPLPKALDGGWGWVVVFGAFNVNLICDGLSYCFGVLYSELLREYNESKSKTSFVGSVFFGVSMTLGPVSSVLISRYGCRTMTIVGGLTSALGMFLSMFAPTLNVLFITFGLIVGTGFSFCFIANVTIVSFYFEKRLSLATGLAVCGTGFGTIAFAPFMDYLIDNYNLAGLFLILSAVCLNLVVCGMLFRPLSFTEIERRKRMLDAFDQIPYDRGHIELPSYSRSGSAGVAKCRDTMSLVCVPNFKPENLSTRIHSATLIEALKKGTNPHQTLHRYVTNIMFQINYAECLKSTHIESSVDKEILYDKNKDMYTNTFSTTFNTRTKRERLSVTKSSSESALHPPGNKTKLQECKVFLIHLPLYRSDIFFRRQNISSCILGTSCPQLYYSAVDKTKRRFAGEFIQCLKSMVDCSHFHNLFMNLFLVSNFMYYFWVDVPFMYAEDYAGDLEVASSDAVLIISLMGVAITVGQIAFGIVGDMNVDVLMLFATITVMGGFLVACVPLLRGVVAVGSCLVLMGFCLSVNSALSSPLLVKHMGLENLTSGYGLLMMVQGVANFIGPLLAGWISDVTYSYEYTFYTCGAFFVLSGMVLYIFYIPRCCPKRYNKTTKQ